MSFKSIMREFKDIKEGIGSISRRGVEGKHWRGRAKSHIAPDETPEETDQIDQGQWANLPPELLLDIIMRVEESESSWPARVVVVHCASVCRSWREITKEIVKTPEQCGRLTFPISLKQPAPRESPIQCYIKRDNATSTFLLYYGLVPSEGENDKLLLAARKIRRATCSDFIVSLVSDDFSRASKTYIGKLRSNFLGTKFTMHDSEPTFEVPRQLASQTSRRLHPRQVSLRLPACNYCIATITYELNVLRPRGPRRMHCIMHSIPMSSIEEGSTVQTLTSIPETFNGQFPHLSSSIGKELLSDNSSASLSRSPVLAQGSEELLVLKNKAPRWHEQLQCWCLNFRGRVTVASVKNFQLVASAEPSHNVPAADQERVILQFGKIGKDIFTMDYFYPLSAFQAFAISLSSFDTKPACE
ncbi:PREDICTED: tubby-like F-box protein 2 [Populus euphratica]|uniref:Tubby-like F-box protein n=1 Tax=Populus euphratica TaxID=75702 RepID=A0AAJ6TIH9_POPEU|nr:PREDICTED: tubby-like F-box protein 2 [Populus euphratica]XP_011011734.1 PREDICTED: tubby-like F-box protein 2 [Populus euphratica]XP_011011735.1 PREDICTED: tubby-like F-box protein 2 [Populus euphratica]